MPAIFATAADFDSANWIRNGLLRKERPCIDRSAFVAAPVSLKTTNAWPRIFTVSIAMMSPNSENIAYRLFFSSVSMHFGEKGKAWSSVYRLSPLSRSGY